MALINQNSIIGVTSITSLGASNVLTVHTSDTTERLRVTSTGLSFSGTNSSLDSSGNASFNGNVSIGGTLTYEDVTNIDSVGVITARNGIHVPGNGNLVGIGTTNPLSRLHVSGTHNSHIRMTNTDNDAIDLIGDANRSNANTTILAIKANWNGTEVSKIIFQTDADTTNKDDSNILFHTKSSGSSISEKLRILSSGGITFNGDTATANALDDYEEGTWTPGYDTKTASSSAISYSNQTGGSYIKIGRAVYICGRVRTEVSQSLSGTGNIILTGLPFAISSGFDGSSDTQDTVAVFSVQQVDGWNDPPLVLLGQAGFSVLDLYNGTEFNLTVVQSDFDVSSSGNNRMRFSGFYFTDS